MSGNIGYNPGIPAANNNPTTDQPLMQQNTNAIKEIIGVDHVTFEANNSGWHQQVTYVDVKGTGLPGLPTDPASIAYTALGILNPHPQAMFINSQLPVMLSCIKAFGVFTTPSSGSLPISVPLGTGFNVSSISCSQLAPTLTIAVTLANNTINASSTSLNTVVLMSTSNRNFISSSEISGPTVTFRLQSSATGIQVSFAILQN